MQYSINALPSLSLDLVPLNGLVSFSPRVTLSPQTELNIFTFSQVSTVAIARTTNELRQ